MIPSHRSPADGPQDPGLDRFLDALVAGDPDTCTLITDRYLETETPVLRLYEGLFRPALYRVGDLWAANRISVATEHMATAITEGLLNRVYPRLINPRRVGRKVVLATVEDELHQVGAKMAGDIFEMHGWDSLFLGAGQSTDALLATLDAERPDLLGLSFSVYFHLDTLERMLQAVRGDLPGLPILLGGQGMAHGGAEVARGVADVHCMGSLGELEALLGGRTGPGWS